VPGVSGPDGAECARYRVAASDASDLGARELFEYASNAPAAAVLSLVAAAAVAKQHR
jgi:hypothetical protein